MLERQCTMDMPNGFSNVNVNKMIESSRNWNLANDIELLKCLEKFSENIINNASLTLTSMDNLEDSLNESFLKVRTVANKFQAIADNQFIENRVQEEDFVLANDEKETLENQISTESSKAQLLDCIRDCQNALGKKFETVQLSGINSEDEMANSSPIVLVPKNVYKEIRLPLLIGGEQFKTNETLDLRPSADSIDDSIESGGDDDVDETDRSSYYSSSATKENSIQVEANKPIVKPAADIIPRDSHPKHRIPEPPPWISSYPSYDPPRIEDDPPVQPDNLFSTTSLLPEAPILNESTDTLFHEGPEPTSTEPSASYSIEKDEYSKFTTKTEDEDTKSIPYKSSVSREQLLSGRNFASFKEDLARVLSGVKPYRRQSSSDSDGSKSDLSSPAAKVDTSKKVDVIGDFSPPPVPSSRSSPASRPTPQFTDSGDTLSPNNVPTPGSSSAVTLPSVSTNVLENLAKGRVKVKGKRRPPSRKHRQANIDGETTSSTSVDRSANLSNSTVSEDTSVHESTSTQPGSNILSPATDEEDLFVLPAFDLPSDPPNRGLFFGNSLLSPGTTIDDGGLPASPLFSTDTQMDIPPMVHDLPTSSTTSKIMPNASITPAASVNLKKTSPVKIEEPKTKSKVSDSSNSSPADLFSSSIVENDSTRKLSHDSKQFGKVVADADLFSETSSMNDGLNEKLDIFSSTSNENKISSSPPLFTDWAKPSDSSKTNKTSTSKRAIRSGLKWDLLGSDDLSEDLFRSQKKETSSIPSLEESATSKETVGKKESNNIFSPSLSFERSGGGTLFEDESNYSAPDIFAESSSFVGLSLPKSSKDSLFASDDDEDEDSLFKSSKSTSTSKTPESSIKPQGSSQRKNSNGPKNSSSKELVNDPLSSMDQME